LSLDGKGKKGKETARFRKRGEGKYLPSGVKRKGRKKRERPYISPDAERSVAGKER